MRNGFCRKLASHSVSGAQAPAETQTMRVSSGINAQVPAPIPVGLVRLLGRGRARNLE